MNIFLRIFNQIKQVNIKIESVEEKENEKKESKKIVEKNETIIESQKAE